jgi:hypothetical protein
LAQLRLVVHAVEPQAAGEIDQRLLLGQRPQHRRRRLQRRQLAVGVQDAELGIVLAEGGADVGVVGDAVAVLVVAEDQRLDDLAEDAAIAGEVLLDADGAAAEGHDREQIGRLHLLVDEGVGGGIRTHLIGGRHRRQIEIKHEQAAIAIASVAGRWNRDLSLRRRRRGRGSGEQRRRRLCASARWAIGQLLELGEAHGLRFAILGDDKVFCAEAGNGAAVLVSDADRLHNQPGAAPENRRRCLLRGQRYQGHQGDKGHKGRTIPLCPLYPWCP